MKNKVKLHRMINDFTQSQLAEKVQVSKWTISQMELNHYAPSVTLALRIAKALNTTVEEIFMLDTEEP